MHFIYTFYVHKKAQRKRKLRYSINQPLFHEKECEVYTNEKETTSSEERLYWLWSSENTLIRGDCRRMAWKFCVLPVYRSVQKGNGRGLSDLRNHPVCKAYEQRDDDYLRQSELDGLWSSSSVSALSPSSTPRTNTGICISWTTQTINQERSFAYQKSFF